ncbi:MAG: hypothetical protein GX032_02960 [Tenericutes bacterium]|nr:hypothetical protein [Bacilli bacterium]MDD4623880.1 hypothetical protein [Bacilli bacterium]MDD4831270.1 hypothetical protein [Bacilli bacterium]NLV90411.1 hypothetical protein [Mycoplasmatota bacterium]
MFKDNVAKYYNINSILNETKPIIKILSLLLFFIFFLIANNIVFSIIMLLFSLILGVLSKVPFKLYLYRSIPIIIINIIILILGILFNINTFNFLLKSISFSIYYSSYIYSTKISDTNKGVFDILNIIDFYNPRVLSFFTILIHFISIVFVEFIKVINIQIKKGKVQKMDKLIVYTYRLVKGKIKIISNNFELKKYNFKYIENNSVYSSLTIIGSHLMLFFVYLLGKI